MLGGKWLKNIPDGHILSAKNVLYPVLLHAYKTAQGPIMCKILAKRTPDFLFRKKT